VEYITETVQYKSQLDTNTHTHISKITHALNESTG